jgi:hypothetical protein
VGRIGEYARAGRFGGDAETKEPITINAEVLRGAGLVSSAEKPLKILGGGELDVRLMVAAEAFTASARSKIEAAGGYVQPLAPEPAPERPARTPDAAPADAAVAAVEPEAATRGASARTPRRGGVPVAADPDAADPEAADPEPAAIEAAAPGAADPEAIAPHASAPDVATQDEPAGEPETDGPADADRATE